jgi:hypothetical protein
LRQFYKILEGNSSSALRSIVKMNNIGKPQEEQDYNNEYFKPNEKEKEEIVLTEAEKQKKSALDIIIAKKNKCSDMF